MVYIVETIGYNDGLPWEKGSYDNIEDALNHWKVLKENFPRVSHRIVILIEQSQGEQ